MGSKTPRTTDARQGAIALLERDHRDVEELFEQFADAEEGEHLALAERICQLLTVHARIEEEILYPAAKDALSADEDEVALVYEAAVEHDTAKDLIARIEAMSEPDEELKATVKVLSEYIKHHVQEEEGEMFPALEDTDLDLEEMGLQLAARKRELMQELGVEDADSESPTRGRSKVPRDGSHARTPGRPARH